MAWIIMTHTEHKCDKVYIIKFKLPPYYVFNNVDNDSEHQNGTLDYFFLFKFTYNLPTWLESLNGLSEFVLINSGHLNNTWKLKLNNVSYMKKN